MPSMNNAVIKSFQNGCYVDLEVYNECPKSAFAWILRSIILRNFMLMSLIFGHRWEAATIIFNDLFSHLSRHSGLM